MAGLFMLKSILEDIRDSGKINLEAIKDLTKDEKEIVHNLYDENLIVETLVLLNDLDTDEEWERFKKKMGTSKKQVVPFWKPILKYAAIFIGLCSIAYLLQTKREAILEIPVLEESITLKTGEDNLKVIRQGENRQIFTASGEVSGEQKGNKIQYSRNAKINRLIFNELEIPYGKIFDVELSDGTLVHLNSGTKMRYPVKFLKGQKREVFISGEAYFKVAGDKEHPFVVNAGEVAVEVLGTEFNISSYKEDQEIKTVLVEGSVSLSNSVIPKDGVTLKPGQKGAWNKIVKVTEIQEVDVSLYTGWIKGEMIFRNATFEGMVKKLERRYNVSIKNNNLLLGNKILNARFNVDVESIDDVLKSISEIHPFNYRVIDQKVIID